MTNILAAQSAEMRAKAETLLQQADWLLCESWNERMWSDGEPIDPSPTIDQAINGGLSWLETFCFLVFGEVSASLTFRILAVSREVADLYCRPTQLCHQRCETPIGDGRPAVKTGADRNVASTFDQIAGFRAVKVDLRGGVRRFWSAKRSSVSQDGVVGQRALLKSRSQGGAGAKLVAIKSTKARTFAGG